MCWFIQLKVTARKRPDEAAATIERLAERFGVYLRGQFPALYVTDGHCSCDYVQNDGRAIHIASFIEAVVKAEQIKNVEVGWTWGEQIKPEAAVERLSVQEFAAHNVSVSLKPDTWYRLNDPDKYQFQTFRTSMS